MRAQGPAPRPSFPPCPASLVDALAHLSAPSAQCSRRRARRSDQMTGRPHLPASLLLQRAGRAPSPPSLTPRPHSSAPFFHLPSFFPAPSALCSVQPAAALWTSPRRGPTPIPAGPLDSPTRISSLLEASPLEPDHAEPLGDPLRPCAHHGRNPRRGVHAGHARPKSAASSLI